MIRSFQFFKRPLRFQLSFFQQEDGVALFDSAKAMRDEDDGDFVPQVVHRFHHRLFGEVIECTSGFIEDQHLRVVVQRSGDADALALSAREAHAALADGGLVLLRQVADHELVQVGDFRGALHGNLINLFEFYAKGNVGGHCIVGEIDLLRHIANGTLPSTFVVVGDRLAIDGEHAFLGIEQTEDQIHRGGLAAAGGAHQPDRAFRGNGEADAL